jgi:hypothetical protein
MDKIILGLRAILDEKSDAQVLAMLEDLSLSGSSDLERKAAHKLVTPSRPAPLTFRRLRFGPAPSPTSKSSPFEALLS